MGKQTNIAYEHISSKNIIKTAIGCQSCPYKLYAKDKECVTMGIGNIFSNFIFILPTYDVKAKLGYNTLLSLLSETYSSFDNKSIFEDIYITRIVKCDKYNGHGIYHTAIGPCSGYLKYEIEKLGAKHIVFFGSSYDDYVNNGQTALISTVNKTIHKVYSPAILHYDNPKIRDKFFNDLSNILFNNQ